MSTTSHLLKNPLFNLPWTSLTETEQLNASYDRAREIGRAYRFTIADVLYLTPKFWEFHKDNICALDIAAFSLVTIQCNLVAGTLAPFVYECPEYQILLDRILNFDVKFVLRSLPPCVTKLAILRLDSAQFLLTELGHGLDAKNLETTATLLKDGTFDLHTPHAYAAKYMPPTSPIPLHPRVGLVFARLIVNKEDRGVRPFIVYINDGNHMSAGITAKVLPRRAGSKMVDHSITTFNHVLLPKSALLGSLDKPANDRQHFLSVISRISVGTLAISTTMLPILKRCAFVAGKYSLRRKIKAPNGSPMSIISFRTQQAPIIHTLAQIAVFEAWATDCTTKFTDVSLQSTVRHGIATSFKAVLTKATQESLYALAERCGAQGLYEHNHIIESQLESRGISISEGDILTLCIRLASELLLGRYKLPPPLDPRCLLAQHEISVFYECRGLLQKMGGDHRSQEFNRILLPRCQFLVETAGQRMAYEAALSAGVPSTLLAVYQSGIMQQNCSWYVEKGGFTREMVSVMESQALDAAMPLLSQLLDQLDVEPYCVAPVLSDSAMKDFNDRLKPHGDMSVLNQEPARRSKL